MIENRARTINVERRAKFLGGARERNVFAMKFAFAVMKRMHCLAQH
jgi:hypothetical protein